MNFKKARDCYEKAIEINPNYAEAYYNLGVIFGVLGEYQKAKDCFEKAIQLNPGLVNARNNLGALFNLLGEHQKAIGCFEKVIEINPNHANAYSNLGLEFVELGEHQKAKDCFEKAIKINPNHVDTYWNSHSLASSVDEALSILKKLYKIDNKHTKAKITIAALEGFKGNFSMFDDILSSSDSNHQITRSVKWVFSLPKLPNIFFNRWLFFDTIIKLADKS